MKNIRPAEAGSCREPERDIRRNITRIVAFQVIYVLAHYLYDWWPNAVTSLFSGINESVFQHMKIGFYAWLAVSTAEWLVYRPGEFRDFLPSRLLGAVLVPFLFTLIWYLAPGIVGRMPSDLVEIIWANFSILIGGLFIQAIEDQMACRPLSRILKVYAYALAALSVFLYTLFTLRPPWVDLFAEP